MPESKNTDQEALLNHFDFARRIARGLIEDSYACDDVVQDSFAAALKNPPQSQSHAQSFLGTIVRRLSYRHRRSQLRRISHEQQAPTRQNSRSSDDIVATVEINRLVVQALETLPEIYRDVLVLKYFDCCVPRKARSTAARQKEQVYAA